MLATTLRTMQQVTFYLNSCVCTASDAKLFDRRIQSWWCKLLSFKTPRRRDRTSSVFPLPRVMKSSSKVIMANENFLAGGVKGVACSVSPADTLINWFSTPPRRRTHLVSGSRLFLHILVHSLYGLANGREARQTESETKIQNSARYASKWMH